MRLSILQKAFVLLGLSTVMFFFNNCSNSSKFIDPIPPSDNGGFSSKSCSIAPVQITHTNPYVNQTTQSVYLNQTDYPLALCNDGTAPLYVIRKGYGVASNRWVIHLEGGGSCEDTASCTTRAKNSPDLLSTKFFKNGTETFDFTVNMQTNDPAQNPDFFDANIVKIHYCSSDGWAGNSKAGTPNIKDIPKGWHFMGHEIVKAVIQDLLKNQGMSSATEVLFAGVSAGGVGTYNNAAAVRSYLPQSVRFLSLPDAGFASQVAGYDTTQADGISKAAGTPYDQSNVNSYDLWQAVVDMICSTHAITKNDFINCSMGPTITSADDYDVPTFISQTLNDQVQLGKEGLDIGVQQPEPQNTSYRTFFAEQMRAKLKATNDYVSVYAPLNTVHGITDAKTFTTPLPFVTNGVNESISLQAAISQWYKDPCQSVKRVQ